MRPLAIQAAVNALTNGGQALAISLVGQRVIITVMRFGGRDPRPRRFDAINFFAAMPAFAPGWAFEPNPGAGR